MAHISYGNILVMATQIAARGDPPLSEERLSATTACRAPGGNLWTSETAAGELSPNPMRPAAPASQLGGDGRLLGNDDSDSITGGSSGGAASTYGVLPVFAITIWAIRSRS